MQPLNVALTVLFSLLAKFLLITPPITNNTMTTTMKKTLFYHFILPKAQEEEYTKSLASNPTDTTDGDDAATNYPFQFELVDIRHHDAAAPLKTRPFFPWDITKYLTHHDLIRGILGGVLELSPEPVEGHVLSHWDDEKIQKLSARGVKVPITVHDLDFGSRHELFLRKWGAPYAVGGDPDADYCYLIYGPWWKEFVDRRRLKEGMLIGMYWDVDDGSLCFSILDYTVRTVA